MGAETEVGRDEVRVRRAAILTLDQPLHGFTDETIPQSKKRRHRILRLIRYNRNPPNPSSMLESPTYKRTLFYTAIRLRKDTTMEDGEKGNFSFILFKEKNIKNSKSGITY